MTEPRVLLTGFEPFGDDPRNPSMDLARRLDGELVAGHRVETACLPVAFESALAALDAAIGRSRPALVLATGLAGGRARLGFERIAINLVDARIPDNEGAQPVDVAVLPDQPAARFTTLPVKAMAAAARAAGVPAELSLSAGTYVCNAVFYALLARLEADGAGARGGFVHVPWLPEQAATRPGEPSMALETMQLGVLVALEAALATTTDLAVPGGTLC